MAKAAPKHKPGQTFTAGSKAHGGRKWVYKANKAGKAIPVRPHSSNKTDKAGKPAGKPSAPKPDVRPYGAMTDTLNRQADDEFAGEESSAQSAEGVATQHAKDLEVVYDRFKAQLLGQDEAMRSQQNAQLAANTAQQNAATQGLGAAVGQGAAQQAATDKQTGTDYSSQLAGIGAAGAAGSAAVSAPQQTAMLAKSQIDQGLMASLGNLAELEHGRARGQAAQQVQKAKDTRSEIAGRKGKSKADAYRDSLEVERKQVQQEFDNTLAQQTLASDKADSIRDYKAKIADIDARLKGVNATNATALAVASGHDTASTSNAATSASARRDAARTGANATVTAAQLRANSAKTVQKLKDRSKANELKITGGGGKGKATLHTADGKTYVMSEADRKKWNEQRTKSIDAATALRRALGTNPSEGEAIKRVKAATGIKANVVAAMLGAAKGKPATAAQRKALRTYFPGGIIPPGFIEGKVK